jgi:peptide chain release factor 2
MDYPEVNPSDIIITGWSSVEQGSWSLRVPDGIQIVHIPTGKVVTCESERSQHRNRHLALLELSEFLVGVKEGDNYEF